MDPASDVLFGNWILNQYGNAFYLTFVHFTPSSLELFSLPQLVAFYLHTGYPELPYLQIICFLQELLFLCHVPFHPLCCSGWCRDAGIIICCDILDLSVGGILAHSELKDPIPKYVETTPQIGGEASVLKLGDLGWLSWGWPARETWSPVSQRHPDRATENSHKISENDRKQMTLDIPTEFQAQYVWCWVWYLY